MAVNMAKRKRKPPAAAKQADHRGFKAGGPGYKKKPRARYYTIPLTPHDQSLPKEIADQIGSAVSCQLQQGNWQAAHQVIDTAHRPTFEKVRVLDLSVQDVGMPVRIANALVKHNICTIGELLNHTRATLRAIPNLGPQAVEEMIIAAKAALAQSRDGWVWRDTY